MITAADSSSSFKNLSAHAALIERFFESYMGLDIEHSASDFIATYPDELLSSICPESRHLPASLIIDEQHEETFVGIHVSPSLVNIFSNSANLSELLSRREGLNAFLILVEEISHLQHYLGHLRASKVISRFDLELQAELDKVIIGSLAMLQTFGKSYARELVRLSFDESKFTSELTNYPLASKIAERFWKLNLKMFGPDLLFNPNFRSNLQRASRLTGQEKKRLLENVKAA